MHRGASAKGHATAGSRAQAALRATLTEAFAHGACLAQDVDLRCQIALGPRPRYIWHLTPGPCESPCIRQKQCDQARVHRAQKDTSMNFDRGIPHCLPTDPRHCRFCLFPWEGYEGKAGTSASLDVMAREADLHGTVFDAMDQEGWIETRGEELVLVGQGEFHVPLIQSLISPSRVNELTQARKEFAIIPVQAGCLA
jgi:hypothetical protein